MALNIKQLGDWKNILKIILRFVDYKTLLNLTSCCRDFKLLGEKEKSKRKIEYSLGYDFTANRKDYFAKRCIGGLILLYYGDKCKHTQERIECGKYSSISVGEYCSKCNDIIKQTQDSHHKQERINQKKRNEKEQLLRTELGEIGYRKLCQKQNDQRFNEEERIRDTIKLSINNMANNKGKTVFKKKGL
jgi:hypothetical protein